VKNQNKGNTFFLISQVFPEDWCSGLPLFLWRV